jgi:PBP1b-binding outer membrane lipoprotein LpoB
MKKSSFVITLVLIALLIGACGKQAEQKTGQTQQQDSVQSTQQPSTIDSGAIAAKWAETNAASKTEPKSEASIPDTKKAEPQTPEKKVVTETKTETVSPPVVMVIPESTMIKVKLIDSIDSDVHVTGTKFRALLAEPLRVDGKMVYEEGTAVTGVLDNVVESGRLKTPAELSFSLISITDANGNEIPIKTYTIDEKKGSHTNREVGLIGGGAIVGGIVGKLTKKKGGTEIGAAAGAAAGAATAAATGKKDIVHSAGTEAVFILKEPVQVTIKEGPFTKH